MKTYKKEVKRVRRTIIIMLIALLSVAGIAYAAVQGSSVDVVKTDQLTETSAGNTDAEGGNVTMMNLSATVSTQRWAGFYGNVTGTLGLGLGTDVFYSFSAANALTVFASQNQTFDWASIEASTGAEVDAATAWNYAAGNDQAADVYAGAVQVGTTTGAITEVATLQSGNFITGIFDDAAPDGKGNFAFGVNVSSAACFDGTTCDYELMVPADGTETYYFFVEI